MGKGYIMLSSAYSYFTAVQTAVVFPSRTPLGMDYWCHLVLTFSIWQALGTEAPIQGMGAPGEALPPTARGPGCSTRVRRAPLGHVVVWDLCVSGAGGTSWR